MEKIEQHSLFLKRGEERPLKSSCVLLLLCVFTLLLMLLLLLLLPMLPLQLLVLFCKGLMILLFVSVSQVLLQDDLAFLRGG
jgi:hypothetical protein